ncbi:MAG TPA: phenylalanine--tRNA ligase subunit beta, partial [Gemmatimonadaceae bacterium]|nr:phenylalanine--tRNA ligase subunit beta [Gemmatimonadaceae bacterium]
DHEGIMALDIDAAPGTRFLDAIYAGDTRLVIDVLPNRPDLLSHEGLAREIAAAVGADMARPEIPDERPLVVRTNTMKATEGRVGDFTVRLEDTDGCVRYAAALITGVKVGPSPAWLVSRIEAAGARSINNVVDATNYMLHGFGQPMHAFDAEKLAGNRVVVRRNKLGEKITTLDGVSRELDCDAVVIADGEVAQAVGGVIGGKGSEVTDATTEILLEAAAFRPARIRAARRSLGISTDASYRFERSVNVDAIPGLLDYAVRLILAVAGGVPQGAPLDLYPLPQSLQPVRVRLGRANMLLGESVPRDEVERGLASLGFRTEKADGDALKVTPPAWRGDVTEEIDLIEEIARLHGYDSFSSELRPFRPSAVPTPPLYHAMERVRAALVAEGFLETRPMPFVSEEAGGKVRVTNPLAADEAFLRSDLLATLAARAEYNLSRMQGDVRLFEIGSAFVPGVPQRALGLKKVTVPNEKMHVAALLMGSRNPPHFTDGTAARYDEWDARHIAQLIAAVTFPGRYIKLTVTSDGGLWTITAGGTNVGIVKRVQMDAPVWAAPTFGMEIDLEALEPTAAPAPKYEAIPGTPPAKIDLALLVPEKVTALAVEELIRKEAGETLEDVSVFDEFRGKGVPAGSRSIAWALTFRHPERTLKDREVQLRVEKILKALGGELGVTQRTS